MVAVHSCVFFNKPSLFPKSLKNNALEHTVLFSESCLLKYCFYVKERDFSYDLNIWGFPGGLCVHAKSLQLCLILCEPMDYSPPDSFVYEILQARILEWVAGLPRYLNDKDSTYQCRRCRFHPRVGKIPWSRKLGSYTFHHLPLRSPGPGHCDLAPVLAPLSFYLNYTRS